MAGRLQGLGLRYLRPADPDADNCCNRYHAAGNRSTAARAARAGDNHADRPNAATAGAARSSDRDADRRIAAARAARSSANRDAERRASNSYSRGGYTGYRGAAADPSSARTDRAAPY